MLTLPGLLPEVPVREAQARGLPGQVCRPGLALGRLLLLLALLLLAGLLLLMVLPLARGSLSTDGGHSLSLLLGVHNSNLLLLLLAMTGPKPVGPGCQGPRITILHFS